MWRRSNGFIAPPIKDFIASFDLASSSHKPTNTPRQPSQHSQHAHTKTTKLINLLVIFRNPNHKLETIHKFPHIYPKLARPSITHHHAIKSHDRNCKRKFDS